MVIMLVMVLYLTEGNLVGAALLMGGAVPALDLAFDNCYSHGEVSAVVAVSSPLALQ